MPLVVENILNAKPCIRNINPDRLNRNTFNDYFNRLFELAINMFKWENLPDTVDERFLELALCEKGYCLYFNDDIMGNLALTCMIGGELDVYRIPTRRIAFAVNGYQAERTNRDSVLIYNNYLHTPTMQTISLYAERLTAIERAIDVNVNAQKTPIAILTDEKQKRTVEEIYRKYEGNAPVIIGAKNLDLDSVKAITTGAPYVADKLNILKRQIWNEALTFFGIENANTEKRERLVSDEITSNLGGVQAQRYVMLNAREQAADKINRMFGTNISVKFRQDILGLEGVNEDGSLYSGIGNAGKAGLPNSAE
nr:MAG TPA: upper collar protein [Caudoviricetes sp.]